MKIFFTWQIDEKGGRRKDLEGEISKLGVKISPNLDETVHRKTIFRKTRSKKIGKISKSRNAEYFNCRLRNYGHPKKRKSKTRRTDRPAGQFGQFYCRI